MDLRPFLCTDRPCHRGARSVPYRLAADSTNSSSASVCGCVGAERLHRPAPGGDLRRRRARLAAGSNGPTRGSALGSGRIGHLLLSPHFVRPVDLGAVEPALASCTGLRLSFVVQSLVEPCTSQARSAGRRGLTPLHRTSQRPLRALCAAAHVERQAPETWLCPSRQRSSRE